MFSDENILDDLIDTDEVPLNSTNNDVNRNYFLKILK